MGESSKEPDFIEKCGFYPMMNQNRGESLFKCGTVLRDALEDTALDPGCRGKCNRGNKSSLRVYAL